MKKRLVWIFILILLIAIAGAAMIVFLHPSEQGDVSQVEINYGDSQFFTHREREEIMEVVKAAFQKEFPEYTLKELWYVNDLRMLKDVARVEKKHNRRAIVIYSDIERKPGAAVEPEKLSRYKWYLGENAAGYWKVLSHGTDV